ncbi:MAG: preprotein translocase subunit SecE [Candidatus Omnitrophica bacterium]|nr:preprotein translocase subunit SecE [Candidatus Omnitrophota bacterium]MDD5610838.1 preprotein translocase subunit SecE [Candidatus Omnitrophota bacterium]
MNIFKKITGFVGEVKAELEKVAWSTREELKGATTVVIAMTALMAVYIGIVDLSLSKVLTWFLKR